MKEYMETVKLTPAELSNLFIYIFKKRSKNGYVELICVSLWSYGVFCVRIGTLLI
jgi:hypothetical protein